MPYPSKDVQYNSLWYYIEWSSGPEDSKADTWANKFAIVALLIFSFLE